MVRLKVHPVKDKMLSKPISEVAAEYNPDGRCTPSYVCVPHAYPKIKSTGMTEIGHAVLNESWVSIISGSEDYSFKLMRKNQYEEALFRCEDDRFELDMCIETTGSTLCKLWPMRDAFAQMSAEDKALYRLPDDALGAIHYRSVERIYGDQGPQIVELLKKNPVVAIPVVIVRLEQKKAEWLKVREEMNKLWRKVFEQNYQKSLDHRSFYFKQSDKKGLMLKAMLQEIRDAAEKRRLDERQLQGLAAGGSTNSIMLQPDLSFDYNSDVVFDDMHQAVVYGIEEQLTGDVRDAVIAYWHTTVEPFFGRGQKTYQQLHTKTELQQLEAEEHGKESSSSEQDDEKSRGNKNEDGADSGGVTGTDAAQTPEPGTTPEPEDKDDEGDALAALLAAGAGDMSEQEGEGRKSRIRDMSVDPGRREDGDADPDRYYNVCKPLNTRANAAAAAAAESAAAGDKPAFDAHKQHVLYGNDNHYFFFRLHRHVFDRLAAAQRCAKEKNQPQFRQAGDEHMRREVNPQAEAARAEESARLHREFMVMLRKVLDGHMDSSTFEDSCRALLGTNSYVLFTLDKLIQKFIKHMSSMVQDEQTMRLIDLHKYEAARRLPICDEVYRANAHILLHNEPCYRFAFVEGMTGGGEVGNDHAQFTPSIVRQESHAESSTDAPQQVEGGQLQLQLLEPDKSEQQPLDLDSNFQEYIKMLMASPASMNKDRVFLARNTGARSKRDDSCLLDVLQGVAVANGLEFRISCQNSKVSYVLDTEDVMYRQHSSKKQQPEADSRVPKWQKWLEQRCAAVAAAAPATPAAEVAVCPALREPMLKDRCCKPEKRWCMAERQYSGAGIKHGKSTHPGQFVDSFAAARQEVQGQMKELAVKCSNTEDRRHKKAASPMVMPPPAPRCVSKAMQEQLMDQRLSAAAAAFDQLDPMLAMYLGLVADKKYDHIQRHGRCVWVGDMELGDLSRLVARGDKPPALLLGEPWEGHPEHGKPGASINMQELWRKVAGLDLENAVFRARGLMKAAVAAGHLSDDIAARVCCVFIDVAEIKVKQLRDASALQAEKSIGRDIPQLLDEMATSLRHICNSTAFLEKYPHYKTVSELCSKVDAAYMSLQPVLTAVKAAVTQVERMLSLCSKVVVELETRSFNCQLYKRAGEELQKSMLFSYAEVVPLRQAADMLASVSKGLGHHCTTDRVLQMPQVPTQLPRTTKGNYTPQVLAELLDTMLLEDYNVTTPAINKARQLVGDFARSAPDCMPELAHLKRLLQMQEDCSDQQLEKAIEEQESPKATLQKLRNELEFLHTREAALEAKLAASRLLAQQEMPDGVSLDLMRQVKRQRLSLPDKAEALNSGNMQQLADQALKFLDQIQLFRSAMHRSQVVLLERLRQVQHQKQHQR